MRELILHIGTHKTGTTSIQNTLYNEYNGKYSVVKMDLFNNLSEQQDFKNLIDFLIRYNTTDYIVSCESLSGNLFSGYSDFEFLINDFNELCKFYKLKVVVCYREHLSFVESAYSQYIHQGGYGSFQDFINNIDLTNFKYKNHIDVIKRCLPSACLIILAYSKNIVSEFFKAIGEEINVTEVNNKRKNSSFDVESLLVTSKYNKFLNDEEKLILRGFIQNNFPKKIDDNRSVYNAELYKYLSIEFEDDRDSLEKDYLIIFSKEQKEYVIDDVDNAMHIFILKSLISLNRDSNYSYIAKKIERKFRIILSKHPRVYNWFRSKLRS